jgi:glycosyltransferase involved in cell wall biosynthesis
VNAVLIGREDHQALAEAMIILLDQPALAERIGEAQRQVIEEHFTIATVARKHLELYHELVAVQR